MLRMVAQVVRKGSDPGWEGVRPGWAGSDPVGPGSDPGWEGVRPGWAGSEPGGPGRAGPSVRPRAAGPAAVSHEKMTTFRFSHENPCTLCLFLAFIFDFIGII